MGGLVFFKKGFDFSINPDQSLRSPHILAGRFNTAIAHRPGFSPGYLNDAVARLVQGPD